MVKPADIGQPEQLTRDLEDVASGSHVDPFSVLGPHEIGGQRWVTAFVPGAASVYANPKETSAQAPLAPVPGASGCFSGLVPGEGAYILHAADEGGTTWSFEDPYRFGPLLSEGDRARFAQGAYQHLWRLLGAHERTHLGVKGTHFVLWAPAARRASVVGPFNHWDGRRHLMRQHADAGLWEIFLPGVSTGAPYKYEILGLDGALQPPKSDPVGFGSELAPANASVVRDITGYAWGDGEWMAQRADRLRPDAPVSIYELHLGSWRCEADGRPISFQDAATELVRYVADMGFTHIELMPINEHPFDGSWGYQPVGLFCPTVRHGSPDDLRDLVNAAHRAGLGVILDWVPGHFPTDPHGLGKFDGTALYEHADPREGFHPEWNTLIYNYGRAEVKAFLIANARYWLAEYHLDGLRVDAVASMLYRDYARPPGAWVPNKDGGRENYEAIAFIRDVTRMTHEDFPGCVTIAEESTSFPKVTGPEAENGLGFDYKWNMGWMHDALSYLGQPPEARPAHHHTMTFGVTYAFSESFVLPLSHDEVCTGKGSVFGKIPGPPTEKCATLRAFYGFMWGHPGKKLMFMGQEFGQAEDWRHDASVDWAALDDPLHLGVQHLVRDLNAVYRDSPALHRTDADPQGFAWIEADDTQNAVYAWIRRVPDQTIAVLVNFSRNHHAGYRVGLPHADTWQEMLNTDAGLYGGENRGNMGAVHADGTPSHGQPTSASVSLPPLSAVFLRHDA